jgi:hypothetical protein
MASGSILQNGASREMSEGVRSLKICIIGAGKKRALAKLARSDID